MNEAMSTIIIWHRINDLHASDRCPNGTRLDLQGSGATMAPGPDGVECARKTSTNSLNRFASTPQCPALSAAFSSAPHAPSRQSRKGFFIFHGTSGSVSSCGISNRFHSGLPFLNEARRHFCGMFPTNAAIRSSPPFKAGHRD